MEKYPYEISKDQSEEEKKRKQQSSMVASFAIMILLLAGLAAFHPLFQEPPGDPHIEYLILGAIAAFMIFLLFSRSVVMQSREFQRIICPNCNRYIPGDSNSCPYCGKAIISEKKLCPHCGKPLP